MNIFKVFTSKESSPSSSFIPLQATDWNRDGSIFTVVLADKKVEIPYTLNDTFLLGGKIPLTVKLTGSASAPQTVYVQKKLIEEIANKHLLLEDSSSSPKNLGEQITKSLAAIIENNRIAIAGEARRKFIATLELENPHSPQMRNQIQEIFNKAEECDCVDWLSNLLGDETYSSLFTHLILAEPTAMQQDENSIRVAPSFKEQINTVLFRPGNLYEEAKRNESQKAFFEFLLKNYLERICSPMIEKLFLKEILPIDKKNFNGASVCSPFTGQLNRENLAQFFLRQLASANVAIAFGCGFASDKKGFKENELEALTGDYCEACELTFGQERLISLCHADGAGKTNDTHLSAKTFVNKFNENIQQWTEKAPKNIQELMRDVIIPAFISAQKEVLALENAKALTICASLIVPLANGNKVCLGIAVGDVDLFHIDKDNNVKNLTADNTDTVYEILDVAHPKGQAGGYMGGFGNMGNTRMFFKEITAGDRIVTTSDGVTDNILPSATQSDPRVAANILKEAGYTTADIVDASFFTQCTESAALSQLYGLWQEYEIAQIAKNTAAALDDFIIQLTEKAQTQAQRCMGQERVTFGNNDKRIYTTCVTEGENQFVVKPDDISVLALQIK